MIQHWGDRALGDKALECQSKHATMICIPLNVGSSWKMGFFFMEHSYTPAKAFYHLCSMISSYLLIFFFKKCNVMKTRINIQRISHPLSLENEHKWYIIIICIPRENLVKLWRPKQLIILFLLNELFWFFSKNLY